MYIYIYIYTYIRIGLGLPESTLPKSKSSISEQEIRQRKRTAGFISRFGCIINTNGSERRVVLVERKNRKAPVYVHVYIYIYIYIVYCFIACDSRKALLTAWPLLRSAFKGPLERGDPASGSLEPESNDLNNPMRLFAI